MRRAAGVAAYSLLLAVAAQMASAGTTGRLSGHIVDAAKQPLIGVNIAIPAARLGALSNEDGSYSVLNVPAGTYDVRIALLGYQPVVNTGVVVSADNTTTLDVTLKVAPVQMQEVVVKAERPVVDVNQTSQVANISRKQIERLPVQELQDLVNLQAGVVDGHFRGGRAGEVQYQVDGVTVNNPYDNTSSLRLDRSLLEEVQVIQGTFDAEYGQAMSGVVNAVLRSGGDKYEWNGETYAGGYFYSNSGGGGEALIGNRVVEVPGRRAEPFEFRPTDLQSYQLTGSGPLAGKNRFLVTGRYYRSDDYVRGTRVFVPTDTSDFRTASFTRRGRGDGAARLVARWSGVAKLDNHSFQSWNLGYQAILNHIEGQRTNYAFRLNPDGEPSQHTLSIVHGLDVNHTMGKNSYFSATFRQNYFDYRDMAYDDLNDPRYDASGPPKGDPDYEFGAYIQGVDFTRFTQNTNALVAKGIYENQLDRSNHMKLGAEYQYTLLQFGHPGYLVYASDTSGMQHLVRHVAEPPDYPAVSEYRPVSAAGFAQDDLEWNNLRLRGGLRFDFFDARTTVPSDPANPTNTIAGAPLSEPVPTSNKLSFSPRLGVSFPVSRDAALFFAYGHFTQMPALGTMFDNADLGVLNKLQAGGISYGVLGNPDVKPERTVQYQFGYKQALSDWLGLDVSAFYKDIRDLLGVEFISTYNGAEYARLTNVDFGNVVGFTLTLDQRQKGWMSTRIDYTWQFAQGNSSDPRETATRASAGEDPRPRLVPLNWDQRHTLNLTSDISFPNKLYTSMVLRAVSGQPYTPELAAGFGGGLEANSGRKPAALLLDVRAERPLRMLGLGATPFGRSSTFIRAFNGFVFTNSQPVLFAISVRGSRHPARSHAVLGPRRIKSDFVASPELGGRVRPLLPLAVAGGAELRARRRRRIRPGGTGSARGLRLGALRHARRGQHSHRVLELRHGGDYPPDPAMDRACSTCRGAEGTA
jgi:outer membrane receptor protein involved in Fe transport